MIAGMANYQLAEEVTTEKVGVEGEKEEATEMA